MNSINPSSSVNRNDPLSDPVTGDPSQSNQTDTTDRATTVFKKSVRIQDDEKNASLASTTLQPEFTRANLPKNYQLLDNILNKKESYPKELNALCLCFDGALTLFEKYQVENLDNNDYQILTEIFLNIKTINTGNIPDYFILFINKKISNLIESSNNEKTKSLLKSITEELTKESIKLSHSILESEFNQLVEGNLLKSELTPDLSQYVDSSKTIACGRQYSNHKPIKSPPTLTLQATDRSESAKNKYYKKLKNNAINPYTKTINEFKDKLNECEKTTEKSEIISTCNLWIKLLSNKKYEEISTENIKTINSQRVSIETQMKEIFIKRENKIDTSPRKTHNYICLDSIPDLAKIHTAEDLELLNLHLPYIDALKNFYSKNQDDFSKEYHKFFSEFLSIAQKIVTDKEESVKLHEHISAQIKKLEEEIKKLNGKASDFVNNRSLFTEIHSKHKFTLNYLSNILSLTTLLHQRKTFFTCSRLYGNILACLNLELNAKKITIFDNVLKLMFQTISGNFLNSDERIKIEHFFGTNESFNQKSYIHLLRFCRSLKNKKESYKLLETFFKHFHTKVSAIVKSLDQEGATIKATKLRASYSEVCLSLIPIYFCLSDMMILHNENSESLLEQETSLQIPETVIQYFDLPAPEKTQPNPAPLIQNPPLLSHHAQQTEPNNKETNTSSSNATSETVSREESDTPLPSKIKQKKPKSILQPQTEPLLANPSEKPQEEAPNPELRIQKNEDVYTWVKRIQEQYGVNVKITQGGDHIHVYNGNKLVTVASRSNTKDRIPVGTLHSMNKQIEANLKLPTTPDSKSDKD